MQKNILTTLLNDMVSEKGHVTTIYYTAGDNHQQNTSNLEKIQKTLADKPTILAQLNKVINEQKINELRQVTVAIFITDSNNYFYQFDRLDIDSYVAKDTLPVLLPLLELKQSVPERIIVNLAYDQVDVYHVTENSIELLEAAEPLNISTILGDQFRAGETNSRSMGDKQLAVHGHNASREKKAAEHERFYRNVDAAVYALIQEEHADLPIILAGTPDNISQYEDVSKQVSRNIDHNFQIRNQHNNMQDLYRAYKEATGQVNQQTAKYILTKANPKNVINADYTKELALGDKQILIIRKNYFTLPAEQILALSELGISAYKLKLPIYFIDTMDASANMIQVD
ncbi:hypothetical protein WOSG25_051480 [Weissella oryzae SG25]|uniref:Bacterial archaeo-eukaryotic release factor family 6 domain-containing protein n=1 Tax=Weissella oryzae (strain DSM 25784 / JCM 18191 / LMG 30913 / SG25) TaxID=1329250 RepID=A0A069CSU1_WEIOS|nr:hypothetical protein [Weissella oryzae]GAK30875.1 hypothetical protein WOSG25_051480 [Weissella oryzae SG25]